MIVTLSCLIIDDSEKFLASATRLLSLQGVSVIGRASSGDEALRLAAALSPDVTLVDVELGDEDGIEVARRLTSGDLSAMVILISLRDRNELTELMAGSGAIGFLRKDALDAQAVADLIAQWKQRNVAPEPPHFG
ncbi:MAG TPA: response regulator transcription factor [Streptosporangiaceae bacterium]|nr:response regulator transcription factor [Streptosporangiaceae bacterium]